MTPRLFAALLAPTVALSASLAAQETATAKIVELPDFNVYTERELPPPEEWLYARIDGFEVLSNASASRTRDMVTELHRYAYALNLVWSGARPAAHSPAALVICGGGRKFESFLPPDQQNRERAFTTFHRRSPEFSALLVDEQTRALSLAMVDVPATTTAPAATAGPGSDLEAETNEAPVDVGFEIDPQQQLLRQYVHYLLAGLQPHPAPWLAEGLAQLCGRLRITETEISLGRVENPNEVGGRSDRDFNAALANRALMPMAELMAVQPDSATALNPLDSRWAKQSYAFVHWGLYGDLGAHQKNFIRFLVRSEREGLSEALFRECFQQDYAQMLQTLRVHIEHTRAKVAGVRAGKGEKIPWPAPVEVRPATESEIARLKADVFNLMEQPAAAREALVLAYRRGVRDAAILGALGLSEFQAGETVRARKFLEVAAKAGALRPRAYLALAQLRGAERRARPQGTDGRLSSDQLMGVLEPLLLARQQKPLLPEVYEQLAAAWLTCATPPPEPHLGVLEEGVQLFPDRVALRNQVALLKTR